jgi:hypothetical protein
MATINIPGVPDELVARIEADAQSPGETVDSLLRDLLWRTYGSRAIAIAIMRARWAQLPPTSASEVDAWISTGRN